MLNNNFISFDDFKNQLKTKENTPSLFNNQQNAIKPNTYSKELLDEFEYSKKQNGLIEKIADKIKSALKLKNSSEMIKKEIDLKQKTESDIKQDLKIYRQSQESIAQSSADVVSSLGAMSGFFAVKQSIEKIVAQKMSVNNSKEFLCEEIKNINTNNKKYLNFIVNFVEKHLDKRHTAILAGVIPAMILGAIIKKTVLKINNIASKKYKIENKETLSKEELKAKKKEMKKKKKSINRRNGLTGLINGLSVPVISVLGPIGAIPYVLINSLSKYFIGSWEDKNKKNFKNYIEYQKSAPIMQIATAAIIGAAAIQKGQFNKVFEKNFNKALEKIRKAGLEQTVSSTTYYQQLEDILFSNSEISKIMNDSSLSTSEKIRLLSERNIFALKFKQINYSIDDLARALKTDCPPTRTIEEAQKIISNTYGDKYTLTRLAGVGTVAESYLAKSSDGKEVCIKILKDGITQEKIAADKDKFIEIIKKLDRSDEEKEFLIKNVENIAQGVIQEVDLTNEMKTAQELAKVTKKANLVKPIEVKDNIYVMEKAKGITLNDLMEYQSNSWFMKNNTLEELEQKRKHYQKRIDELKKELEEWDDTSFHYSSKEKTQEIIEYHERILNNTLEDIARYKKCLELRKLGVESLDEAQIKRMFENYQDVLVEQFSQINKKGKIIHADIHPGNIFIDLEALKRGDKKIFTLIDTGNTIQQSQQMAIRFINLTNYIKNADFDNITSFVLEGAQLPQNMTPEQAHEKMVQELKKYFFDDETYLGKMTNDSILAICEQISQKLGIIPSDAQGNLTKAKRSAHQSLEGFMKNFRNAIGEELNRKHTVEGKVQYDSASYITDSIFGLLKMGISNVKLPVKQKAQETINLYKLPLSQRVKLKASKSAPKKNSEEYLTYILKQERKTIQEILNDLCREADFFLNRILCWGDKIDPITKSNLEILKDRLFNKQYKNEEEMNEIIKKMRKIYSDNGIDILDKKEKLKSVQRIIDKIPDKAKEVKEQMQELFDIAKKILEE